MNRQKGQFIGRLLVAVLLTAAMTFQSFAASARIAFSDPSSQVGQEVSVTMKFTSTDGQLLGCKAIDLVVREGKEGEVYNVGGHNEKTNLEIVKLTIATIHRLMADNSEYRKILKKKVKDANGEISIDWINEDLITFVKDRLGHDQRYAIDPTKITNALGWRPETKFEVGIVKTIEWYLENQAWVEEVTSGDYQGYYEKMYGK